jgi:hypothetical protein
MAVAVAALEEFQRDTSLVEPQHWVRTNHGAVHRRRPDGDPAREFIDP